MHLPIALLKTVVTRVCTNCYQFAEPGDMDSLVLWLTVPDRCSQIYQYATRKINIATHTKIVSPMILERLPVFIDAKWSTNRRNLFI